MKFKKIKFTAKNEIINHISEIPKPGTSHVPEWYRKEKQFIGSTNNFISMVKQGNRGTTYKMCVPLVDSLTSGYIIALDSDIVVINTISDGYVPQVSWTSGNQVLDPVELESLANYPVPFGYSPYALRWHSSWHIETPRGYSLWVTHPSHRNELPFFTINGFVDTDKHPNVLVFPFFVRDGFEGIIPAGTPIAQILPIKRDAWKSTTGKYTEIQNEYNLEKIKRFLIRSYKRQFWTRKVYK